MKQSSIEWFIDTMQRSAGLDQKQIDKIYEEAKAMYEDEMKKFGIKCQMAMYSSDHVWSVEDVWDKEIKKQQNETE